MIFFSSCSSIKKIDQNFIDKIVLSSTVKNCHIAVEKIISKLLKSKNIPITNNTLFFCNILENNTSNDINKDELIDIIKNNITKHANNISFITDKKINKSKKQIGLLNTKNIIDTKTAILLSRKNHATYYLESDISGNRPKFFLTIKVILVATGEIIFLKTEKLY